MDASTHQVNSNCITFCKQLPFYKRDIAAIGAALAVIVTLSSILAFIAIHYHCLGPLNALSHLSNVGASVFLTISVTAIVSYLIWAKFFKKSIVILKNEHGEMRYIRPGKTKCMRQILFKWFNNIDQSNDPYLSSHAFEQPKALENPRKHVEDFKLLWAAAEKRELTKELFFEIISHPSSYLLLKKSFMGTTTTSHPTLSLNECACSTTHAFNRLIPQDQNRRKQFEHAIVQHVLNVVPNKSDPVHFIDMGSGNLLQVWMIVGHLMKEGYMNFKIRAIEPNDNQEALTSFIDFFQKMGCTMEIVKYTNINEFPDAEQAQVHFVSAIDFDDFEKALSDLKKSMEFLDESGKLFLGYASDDFIVSSNKTHVLTMDSHCTHMTNHMKRHLPQNKEIVRIEVKNNLYRPLLQGVAELSRHGYDKIEIYYKDLTEEIENMTKALFQHVVISFVEKMSGADFLILSTQSDEKITAKNIYLFLEKLEIIQG